MKRLVLFDIDGTLLNGGKLWREIFEKSLCQAFPGVQFPKTPFSGKTDRQICREMLEGAANLPLNSCQLSCQMDRQIDKMMDAYLQELAETLLTARASEVEVLPGVGALLQRLNSHEQVCLGLLTGNVKLGAFLKLKAVALDSYFTWGAFGDDSADRNDLPAIALQRAKSEFGNLFQGHQVVVIGDTHHDVNCCKGVSARSIAVGTGSREYRAEIMKAAPHYFFETLEPTEEIISAIIS